MVNTTTPASSSNIWVATSDGDFDRVKHLIETEGLSANAKDENGYTPLHAAVSYGHATILRYLLSKGGDINIPDNDGDTPLFTVETLEICKLVLELGGDPSLINQENKTAAQSLFEENPEISEFLCTLTGEALPTASEQSEELGEEGDISTTAMADSTPLPPARPPVTVPEEVTALDPDSREVAIETNNRAGALLERVQAILLECDASGEDPEPRISAIVNEAVQSSMRAGREMATRAVAAGQEDASEAAKQPEAPKEEQPQR